MKTNPLDNARKGTNSHYEQAMKDFLKKAQKECCGMA
jgi:hypothetical protein